MRSHTNFGRNILVTHSQSEIGHNKWNYLKTKLFWGSGIIRDDLKQETTSSINIFQTAFDLLRRKLPCICCKMWCTFELWDRATGNWVVQSRINVILKEICAVQGGDGGYMARMTSWDINSNRNGHCRVHIWNMFLSQVLPVGSSGQFLVKAQGNWGTRVNAAKNWYFWMNLKKKWIGEWKWNFDLVDACLQTSKVTISE